MEEDTNVQVKPTKSRRGFASMDATRQREISSKGGKTAHILGHAHEFSVQEARDAGKKGGEARSRNRKSKLSEQPQP
ncbi:MAG: hypothetical protein KF829_06790 [Ferruginibacter sp.]|nr:hypothetical protein [Ferruginibacter sp.]